MVNIIDDTRQVYITIETGLQNFLTYTEIEEPTEENITVTKNQVTYTNANRNVLESVYKDFSNNPFSDFTHQFTHMLINQSNKWNSIHGIWGLTNGAHSLQDMINQGNGLSLFWTTANDNRVLRLSQYPVIADYSVPLDLNTEYNVVINRTGTTITCKIYSGTTLVDTLSLTGTLTRTYNTILTYHSYNNPSFNATASGYIKNLIL